ncbi:MAG: hypothetical protein V1740_03555 [Candidatus Woesearchaeota archaeon]
MARKTNKKTRKKRNTVEKHHDIRIMPIIIGILGVLLITILFFQDFDINITGYAVAEIGEPVYCVKIGRDDKFVGITDKSSCCFLIENTDRCKKYTSVVDYEPDGRFKFKYDCIGGSTRRVLYEDIALRYCGAYLD